MTLRIFVGNVLYVAMVLALVVGIFACFSR